MTIRVKAFLLFIFKLNGGETSTICQ